MSLTLKGVEVTLRPLLREDVDALAGVTSDAPEVYKFSTAPVGFEQTQVYVAKALAQSADGFRMPFVVLWRGRVVGSTSYSELEPWKWPAGSALQRSGVPDSVEIGYTWLATSAQRTRCNTEAKYLLLKHAFETWQVHSVTIRTDERNLRSRRAIERLGAKLDGIRRAHCAGADGAIRNTVFYSMLPSEWPDARAALLKKLR